MAFPNAFRAPFALAGLWLTLATPAQTPRPPLTDTPRGSLRADLSGRSPAASLRLSSNALQRSGGSLRASLLEVSQRIGVQQVGEFAAQATRTIVRPAPAPSEAELLVRRGDQLLDAGNAEEAVDVYRKAIAKQPRLTSARTGLGYALIETGDFDAAIAEYRQALTADPTDTQIQLNLGVALYRGGLIDEAIDQYQQVVARTKALPAAYFNLGMAYAHQGKFDAAIEQYQAALRLRRNFSEAYNNLGLILEAKGEPDKATEQYRLAVSAGRAPLARYNLARAYQAQGPAQYEKAIAELQTAVKEQPKFPEAHLNLGNIHLLRGELNDDPTAIDRAIENYRKAIAQRDNFYPLAYEHLAIALTLKGDKTGALAAYRTAFSQNDGTSAEALENLVSTLLDNRERLLIGNEQSRSANPGNLRSSIRTQEQRKSDIDALTEALGRYEELSDDVKNSPDVRFCAGMVYLTAGFPKEACTEFSLAVRLSGGKDADASRMLLGTVHRFVFP